MGYAGFLIVFVGAGIGGMLRHGVTLLSARLWGTDFPYGTMTVNVLGSFLMGAITAYWAQRSGLPQPVRLLLTTGIMGGFTTFSTFSLDTVTLWEKGAALTAAGYALASVLVSFAALAGGIALVRALTAPAG